MTTTDRRASTSPPRLRHHASAATFAAVGTVALLGVGIVTDRPNWPVYAVVMVVGGVAVALLDRRVHLSRATVWGLAVFGVGHVAGGMVPVGDGTLYGWWLVDGVLRYDNLQHAWGFGFVGRATWESLRGRLDPAPGHVRAVAGWIIVLGAAAGGAVNEIVEYVMVLTIPGTDVGGYDNTARDLIANLVGGLVAATWTTRRLP